MLAVPDIEVPSNPGQPALRVGPRTSQGLYARGALFIHRARLPGAPGNSENHVARPQPGCGPRVLFRDAKQSVFDCHRCLRMECALDQRPPA